MIYLFLVPKKADENLVPLDNEWQIATREGKVMTTTTTGHFGGKMPLVEAGPIFLDTIPNEDIQSAFYDPA